MPAERLVRTPPSSNPSAPPAGGDGGVDAYRLGPLVGLREQVDDHSEQDCGGRRGAGALNEAVDDEQRFDCRTGRTTATRG
jgi:hypothetical protein